MKHCKFCEGIIVNTIDADKYPRFCTAECYFNYVYRKGMRVEKKHVWDTLGKHWHPVTDEDCFTQGCWEYRLSRPDRT